MITYIIFGADSDTLGYVSTDTELTKEQLIDYCNKEVSFLIRLKDGKIHESSFNEFIYDDEWIVTDMNIYWTEITQFHSV